MRCLRLVPLLAFLPTLVPLHAATFCVGTTADFQAALTTAASNGEDDLIKVKSGAYVLDELLSYGSSQNFALTIMGGYHSLGPVQCALLFPDPSGTILDGQYQTPLISLSGNTGSGSITLSHLTFRNGIGAEGNHPVFVGGYAGYSGDVLIEDNVFTGLVGTMAGGITAVQLSVDHGSLTVRDNLFTANTTDSRKQPVDVLLNAAPIVPDAATINPNGGFNNNTVSGSISTDYAVALRGFGTWSAANNILWGNPNSDLLLGQHVSLYNNDIGTYQGTPEQLADGVSVDPQFVDDVGGDYRLRGNSPLVNQGFNTPYGGIGTYDAGGEARVAFGIVDLGAYELHDVLFANGFD